jgi:hypothetical protein
MALLEVLLSHSEVDFVLLLNDFVLKAAIVHVLLQLFMFGHLLGLRVLE